MVLSPAPRPRLPGIRLGPKYDSSTSMVPLKGLFCSHQSAIFPRSLSNILVIERKEIRLSSDVSVAAGSMEKYLMIYLIIVYVIFNHFNYILLFIYILLTMYGIVVYVH